MTASLPAMGSSVVMYGRDLTLLNTRAWVLRSESFLVHCASEYTAAEELIFNNHGNVVVLCHSVLAADRESLRSALREIRPLIKCLLLIASVAIHDLTPNELAVETFNGPTALILALNQMTGRHVTLESGQATLTSFRRG